ncbi:TDP-N-acetylfucosamine:lipid II N-acetylfucosaminyltransferase [Halopseudomonas salegens]|uniref:4-alpha-L-fucosyltransferase glycosyl transferase group 56 n=1 Tax=Halopseudomonas salegens TaxID=1434072 RepID=A0A1H2FLQ2_9GAMM|nr:TDP-N-acetylfucosamine:lipid II N-acetylfucosaminyltransferase [Halopseudomonas salegens]SDU08267.1 4-alpha-L-fucosyltransferase glycosyl transferase group 56 [Halopseudomonas salegens]
MKILHIATDDKFIEQAIPVFESVFPGKNDVIIFTKTTPLQYVKLQTAKVVLKNKLFFTRAAVDREIYNRYEIIVFHSFSHLTYPEIFNIPINKATIWLGWGYDYYEDTLGKDTLLLEKTLNLSKRLEPTTPIYVIKKIIKKSAVFLGVIASKKKAIERLTIFAPVLPSEFDMVKNSKNWKRFPDHAIWNYGTIEDNLIKGFETESVSGNSILVGNSASLECNHAEAFDILKSIGISDRKVVVPLSYGQLEYSKLISTLGKDYFGENCESLNTFMPIEDYVKTIRKCGYVIMNHKRQQAVGNIVIMLYLGARVFVRTENPVFRFFNSLGIQLSTMEELENNHDLINTPLSRAERAWNRKTVSNYWSREKAFRRTEQLINNAFSLSQQYNTDSKKH